MTPAGNHIAFEMNIDVIPVGELLGHLFMDLWIGEANAGEGLIAKNDSKAESVERLIPLPDRDLVMRLDLLEQAREVETSGASSDHGNLHGVESFLGRAGHSGNLTIANPTIEVLAMPHVK